MIRKARKVAAVVGRVVAAKAAVMAVATGEARVAVMEAERVVAMGAVMEAERVVAMEAERVVAMAAAMAVGMAVATGEKTAEVARAVVAGPMRYLCPLESTHTVYLRLHSLGTGPGLFYARNSGSTKELATFSTTCNFSFRIGFVLKT